VHELDADTALYFPEGQLKHTLPPVLDWKVPAAQIEQELAPEEDLYPVAHDSQLEAADDEYFPPGQVVQLVAKATE